MNDTDPLKVEPITDRAETGPRRRFRFPPSRPATTCVCGYPLLPNQTCPECGKAFEWRIPRKRLGVWTILLGIFVGEVAAFFVLLALTESDVLHDMAAAALFGLCLIVGMCMTIITLCLHPPRRFAATPLGRLMWRVIVIGVPVLYVLLMTMFRGPPRP